MKTSKLIGAALDWAVAKCEGILDRGSGPLNTAIAKLTRNGIVLNFSADDSYFEPSTNWSQAGQIIEREIMTLERDNDQWFARSKYGNEALGQSPLIAAMRCYVASKLGDEVEVPEEFLPC